MPLIVMTGIPSCGKTKMAIDLKIFFENKDKKVKIICENDIIKNAGFDKNDLYSSSQKEKEIRSIIKSDYTRLISPNEVTIIDGLNYIKGYRYELYCASKASQTTQCTVLCLVTPKQAWEYNLSRDTNEQYSKEVFDALIQRYEEPNDKNRWDSPLFVYANNPNNTIEFDTLHDALYLRKPPPPNLSTLSTPLSDSNYLYELNCAVQEVIQTIINAKDSIVEGEVKIEGCNEVFLMSSEKNINYHKLLRMKRQFFNYVRNHPNLHNKNVTSLFVQYLNSNL